MENRIIRRGKIYLIRYRVAGRVIRECSGTRYSEAQRLLEKRLREIKGLKDSFLARE